MTTPTAVPMATSTATMRIGELAARTGVSQRLLRYYEQQGLLTPARTPAGYRIYDEASVVTVRQIRALLAAGLTTQVIRRILPCAVGAEPKLQPCDDLLATLRAKLRSLDEQMAALRETRQILAQIVAATDASYASCPAPPAPVARRAS